MLRAHAWRPQMVGMVFIPGCLNIILGLMTASMRSFLQSSRSQIFTLMSHTQSSCWRFGLASMLQGIGKGAPRKHGFLRTYWVDCQLAGTPTPLLQRTPPPLVSLIDKLWPSTPNKDRSLLVSLSELRMSVLHWPCQTSSCLGHTCVAAKGTGLSASQSFFSFSRTERTRQ